MSRESRDRFERSYKVPACVKACTTGGLTYGRRDELIEEARSRMAAEPDRYHAHIYGEKEVGGAAYLYLTNVPFESLGFRMDLGERSYPSYTKTALGLVPAGVVGLGVALGGIHLWAKRKAAVAAEENAAKGGK
jgi:formate dehydrogenase iron-sulfur subunit